MKEDPASAQLNLEKISYVGLITMSTLMVPAFFSLSALDFSATISIIAFAISLPLLVAVLLRDQIQLIGKVKRNWLSPRGQFITRVFGPAFTVIGLAAAIWHMSWLAGIFFLLSSVCMWKVFHHAIGSAYREMKAEIIQQQPTEKLRRENGYAYAPKVSSV